MTVACPSPEWPSGLLEQGPPQDPSILLRGEATIGSARFVVTAVRVNPIRYGPDFRPDQSTSIYANCNLSALLDSLSDLIEVSEASTLRLETGNYVIWMLPQSGGE
jgi:hypothetical protein